MEKKREKAKQITKKPANLSKTPSYGKVRFLEEYRNTLDYGIYPLTESFLEKLSLDLIKWANEDPKALRMEQFAKSKHINTSTFKTWVKKYPILAEAYQEAKSSISIRREIHAKDLPILPSMLERSMPMYDEGGPENWKELYEWRAGLTAQAAGKNENQRIVVELAQIPNSTLVPKKKESE